MNQRSTEQEIQSHYRNLKLDEDRMNALLEVHDLAARARTWKVVALTAAGALAATAIGAAYLLLNWTPASSPLIPTAENAPGGPAVQTPKDSLQNPPPNPMLVQPEEAPKSKDPPQTAIPEFRLVAFRSHGDGCPHCRKTARVYDSLAENLRDEALKFDQFDLRDGPKTRATVAEQGMQALIQGRAETAFLALVTADGAQVREFKPSQGVEAISHQVRRLIGE